MEEIIKKADVLIEALPYIKRFRGTSFVIKYGGSAIVNEQIRKSVLNDIVFMNYVGIKVVLIHGGGSLIQERMKEKGKVAKYVDGLRVTDKETMGIVKQTLADLNKEIVEQLKELGVAAKGFSPEKDAFIRARKFSPEGEELGYVGEVESVNVNALNKILAGFLPVIYPVGFDSQGELYNINADEVASEVASGLAAEKLVLLTNVKGIMRDAEKEETLMPSLRVDDVENLINDGVISEGMIPKVKAGVKAVEAGVKKVHVIDAKITHSLLLEIFTDEGIGTEIVK